MLIPYSEDDKGIPGHTSGVPIPGHTSSSDEAIEIKIGQIPGYTSSSDSDETIEINVVREIPGHTACGHTMEAAKTLATLAAGGDPDWLPDLTVPETVLRRPMLKFLMIQVHKQVQMLKFLGLQTFWEGKVLGHSEQLLDAVYFFFHGTLYSLVFTTLTFLQCLCLLDSWEYSVLLPDSVLLSVSDSWAYCESSSEL